MMGWCPYDNKECRHDGYCEDCERTMINAKPSKHGTEERVMKKEEIDRIECAIRHIQTAVDVDPWAVEIAVSAMEKQIPKKPMISVCVDNENLWHLHCPTCGTWVGMHNRRLKSTDMHNNMNSEICAKCGQMFELEFEEGE